MFRPYKPYFLLVLLALSCAESSEVTIDCDALTIQLITSAPAGCGSSDGSITILASDGQPPYIFRIKESDYVATAHFSQLEAGTYSVTVMDDAGCTATDSVQVTTDVGLTTDIMPIMESSCTVGSCHVLIGPELATSDQVHSQAGPIFNSVTEGRMPPDTEPTLSEESISLIRCWYEDGAPDN